MTAVCSKPRLIPFTNGLCWPHEKFHDNRVMQFSSKGTSWYSNVAMLCRDIHFTIIPLFPLELALESVGMLLTRCLF